MTVDDVRAFWRRHYAPERAIVSIAGDVAHDEMLALVEQLAAGWPAAPPGGEVVAPPPAEPQEPDLEARYASGQTTYIYAGVRALAATHPDRPALELLSCALGQLA